MHFMSWLDVVGGG